MSGTIVFSLRAPWTPARMAEHLDELTDALSFTWGDDEPTDLYVEIDMTASGALNAVKRAVSEADSYSTCRFTDEVSRQLLSIIVNDQLGDKQRAVRAPIVRKINRPVGRPAPLTIGRERSAVLFATESKGRESRLARFAGSRREALHNRERWFALSPHYGLVSDDAPSLATLQMGPIPPEHAATWASWVSIRLDTALGSIEAARIRIDAPRQYHQLLRPELLSRGAIVVAEDG